MSLKNASNSKKKPCIWKSDKTLSEMSTILSIDPDEGPINLVYRICPESIASNDSEIADSGGTSQIETSFAFLSRGFDSNLERSDVQKGISTVSMTADAVQ